MKLLPTYKDYIWGGVKLNRYYGKHSGMERTAESWELSCHRDGKSVIANGEYKGMTLSDYVETAGRQVLGTDCAGFDRFPVLIKFIDAADNLSVQVHPDNAYALKNEGEFGKMEMWYIVDCEKDASLICGFRRPVTKEEFRKRIDNHTLLEVLRSVPVSKGDVFMIKAGTVHAIGKGILVAEIQQNSNSTYRVYDYGRVGKDGKPRELQIDKAVDVADTRPAYFQDGAREPAVLEGYTVRRLASCPYFTVCLYDITLSAGASAGGDSFQSFTCVEGRLSFSGRGSGGEHAEFEVNQGDTVFLPAGLGKYRLAGTGKILLTSV